MEPCVEKTKLLHPCKSLVWATSMTKLYYPYRIKIFQTLIVGSSCMVCISWVRCDSYKYLFKPFQLPSIYVLNGLSLIDLKNAISGNLKHKEHHENVGMRLCPLQRWIKIFQGVLKQNKTATDNI
jgi:hypothetical protein